MVAQALEQQIEELYMRLLIVTWIIVITGLPVDADLDRIIPRPKEVRAVGDPVPLEGFRIVPASGERVRIAADEINERIASLGGRRLPVHELEARLPDGKAIVIAPCTAPSLPLKRFGIQATPSDPGPQGYVIRPVGTGRQLKLFLIGSDTLGTLYAAATCRQLIVRRGGKLLLQPATARDWPDYKWREHGMAFAEHLRGDWYAILAAERKGDLDKARKLAATWVALQKRYFDWMLRAKINLAWHGVNFKPGDAPAYTSVAAAALREIHQYGLGRGIGAMAGDTTAIGTYPRDKDNPDFKNVVRHRSHNRYFCWSRLEYHKRRARRAARWLADAGYTGYYLHATDGGGWQNPELWNDRCPRCRRAYGDDRARADAAVFGIYYRETKKRIPNLKFVAVVYPYTGRYLDPDWLYEQAAKLMGVGEPARQLAQRTTKKLTEFLRRLNTLLPQDVFVCIRESERRYIDLARAAWGKRRFQLYYEYTYWKGWRPYFITAPLWTRTFYSRSHDDILFSPLHAWTEVTQLLGAECSWNVNRPGAREFDRQRWLAIGTAVPPPPQRRTFADRACRFLFGDKAGPLVAPVFAENISHTFITRPGEVMRRLHIDDPVGAMFAQAGATGRAAASLDRLWKLQQKSPVLTGDRYGHFLNWYLMTHGAHVLATHRAHVLAARAAIQKGHRAKAEERLSAARGHLAKAAPRWEAIRKRVPRDKLFRRYMRKTSTAGMVFHLDVAALRQEVEDLWRRREKLIAAHTIPKWFERTCRQRDIVAVPAAGPIKVDGRLNEPAWHEAWRTQHFIDYRVLRLEALETWARVLYDPNGLYVGFDCFDPKPSAIRLAMGGRDEHVLCDSVEVLVAPRGGSKEFVHWIVDSKGTVFDARAAKAPDGRVVYSRRWNGAARVAVARGTDRWIVEMAIPAADLGLRPGAGRACRALLCRNIVHTRPKGEEEQNAIVFLDGSNFHTVGKFASLRFAGADEGKPRPRLGLVLQPMTFKHVTTGDGSGTAIGGDLRIETDTYLHDVCVTASFTDGVKLLGEKKLGEARLARLIWRPQRPFAVLFPAEVPGVVCTLKVTCREGEWAFARRYGNPRRSTVPPEKLFAHGVDDAARRALATPAFFSSTNPNTIQLAEGTIEFWLRPRWDVVPIRPGPGWSLAHTFLNMGPIRPDYPYLSNRDSLTIAHHCDGYLRCVISNSHYEPRTVAAGVGGWRRGEWHHVALQWKLDDGGKTSMALFIDGKLASDQCRGSARHPNTRPLKAKQLPLPIQIGSMNTGFRPAEAAIDELRISSVRRYTGAFTPVKRSEPDSHTLALFHFDGTLEAAAPKGVQATAGPAQ